ncbi:MAG: type II toxin-antitoxin system VapC family toxin [Deltaproteobacteria bacterium]|nr:type II toxin-antitoxin system VapC family toxin [Deltaproteobacteria bacterium]MBI3387594.1 type II toxin-antitoxin system VapC family toxin [Deltaproteobacteria bacterium]
MKLLLDTHTLVWWDSGELPRPVSRRIESAEVVFVSAVVAWEIAIKSSLGRIVAKAPVEAVLEDYGFLELAVSIRHADKVRTLPLHHRDPFDRLLVAQALVEDLVIVSADRLLREYKAPIVWD